MKEEAREALWLGIEKLEAAGKSKALAEAYRIISDMYSDEGEYEKAFKYLKDSNELYGDVTINTLYY